MNEWTSKKLKLLDTSSLTGLLKANLPSAGRLRTDLTVSYNTIAHVMRLGCAWNHMEYPLAHYRRDYSQSAVRVGSGLASSTEAYSIMLRL